MVPAGFGADVHGVADLAGQPQRGAGVIDGGLGSPTVATYLGLPSVRGRVGAAGALQ